VNDDLISRCLLLCYCCCCCCYYCCLYYSLLCESSIFVGWGFCVLLHNPYECLGCLKLLDTQVVSLSRRECRMGPRILRLGCRSRMQIHHKGRTFLRHPAHKELGGLLMCRSSLSRICERSE
jgi:hypothetical protein